MVSEEIAGLRLTANMCRSIDELIEFLYRDTSRAARRSSSTQKR
jgi:hypothetical protein